MIRVRTLSCIGIALLLCGTGKAQHALGSVDFDEGWKLHIGETTGITGTGTDSRSAAGTMGATAGIFSTGFDDSKWRAVSLPHDGSIEGAFSPDNPAGANGGYLPTGVGYYRKVFSLPAEKKDRLVFIGFDGVYRNSEVWINGHYLGKRPNGYISFYYELTSHIHFGDRPNIILVKVDNQAQPGSRWYTGSGICRHVRLRLTHAVHLDPWSVTITAPVISSGEAILHIRTAVSNSSGEQKNVTIKNILLDRHSKAIAQARSVIGIGAATNATVLQDIVVPTPHLWSDTDPCLYSVVTQVLENNILLDQYTTPYGIRSFSFSPAGGFILNGKKVKIRGVCDHADLGCLGAAVNSSAIARQLRILKEMGCNALRTAHNPPAPELLDLCDRMGFIVMDEAFDVWKIAKTPFDYHWNWDEWHRQDLEDQVKRDRNHPSVFIWSIGNEIPEQLDGNDGASIARELRDIIRSLDTTRPITAGNNQPQKENKLIASGALDLIGYNYRHDTWPDFPQRYPGAIFIGTETVSALETRGEYSFPSDSLIRWGNAQHPVRKDPFDYTCPAYDQVSTPWGSTHEEALTLFAKYDFLSGMFVWTGFDYLGEPTPYGWPARSSYFGIVDLAGFPKDVYYLYQSVWTTRPVLHIFPHWNWKEGQLVDVWAYYNDADEVELFVNGRSVGLRKRSPGHLHVMWRVPFHPGTLRAVSRRLGRTVLSKEVRTAGPAAAIRLVADRTNLDAADRELAFVRAEVVDASGTVVPGADDLISFSVIGNATVAGVDNGNPLSHESFKAPFRKAFHGLALVVVAAGSAGKVVLSANAAGLRPAAVTLQYK